jgi:pimeloyl-ACP methyl ester carboxylesterase
MSISGAEVSRFPCAFRFSLDMWKIMKLLRILAVPVALMCIGAGLWRLEGATAGLKITHASAGRTPVTVFQREGGGPAPVVVIAHGFAGSQQLMQPFATTLARSGFIAVTYDCLGHGRNPVPMSGDVASEKNGPTPLLVAEFGRVVDFARGLPGADGRIAVLAHSMTTNIVVRYTETHPEVAATVAVSLFSPAVTATTPKNLAVIDGGYEFSHLKNEGLRVVSMVAGGEASPGVIYGSFADGTARRVTFSPGVEHLGVLYSPASMAEARDWLNRVFGENSGGGYLDARGPYLGLLFFGLVLLAWPLASVLPVVSEPPQGAGLRWRTFWPVAVAPAILTPLILWKAPTDFLPTVVADYITVHFALYGLLTLAALWIVTRGDLSGASRVRTNYLALLAAALFAGAYSIFAFGFALDRYALSFFPIPERAPLLLAVGAGTLSFFLADEWATRGPGAPRGGYILTKVLFLISLALAAALSFKKLFFLIFIIPIVLTFFVIYGLFSGWTYRRTGSPLVGGAVNALAFAWAIAVTFPMLAR